MTRKIKERFLKRFRSAFLWRIIVAGTKTYDTVLSHLGVFRSFGIDFGPLRIWNKPTKQWIEKHPEFAGRYLKIYNVSAASVKTPKALDPEIHPTLAKFRSEPSYEQFVAEIPSGRILGTYTNITPDGYILWDSAWYLNEDLHSNPHTYRLWLPEFERKEETIALLTSNDSYRNYYHWMLYVLPKYHLFERSGIVIDRYATDCSTRYHKESLQALGITQDRILQIGDDTKIEARNLVVASTPSLCGNLPNWVVQFLRETFIPDGSIARRKRLFVTRVTNRKIVNEDEIFRYLEKLGFERIVLDNMSLREQANLFDSAEAVVGPHGAGLTNLVFCRPGTKVLELFHSETVFGHYYCLSNACNLDYGYLVGEPVRDDSRIPMDQDMRIDPKELGKILERLLNS